MKNVPLKKEKDILNTNETMNDYSFFYQMICEHKVMDFETHENEFIGQEVWR